MRVIYTCLFLFLFLGSVAAQEDDNTFISSSSWNFSIGLGGDIPVGDLADRFGSNLAFKAMVERQTGTNWVYGLQYDFGFGNTVKEDVLSPLRVENGNLQGINQSFGTVILRQRSEYIGLHLGRIIPLSDKYKSGIKISISSGIFQHKVRIIDDERNFTPAAGDYIKGYDRLTRGIGIKEFVGYQYLAEDKRINFYIGLEFGQAFTSPVRKYDFTTYTENSTSRRFDGTIGLRVGWILPFYSGYEDTEIFY